MAFEYTQAYLNSFRWAKSAYKYANGLLVDQKVNITENVLTSSIYSNLEQIPNSITTDSQWNLATNSTMSNMAGMYQSLETLNSYLLGIQDNTVSRLRQSENTLNQLEATVRSVKTYNQTGSSTLLTLNGGDYSWIETDFKFYTDADPLSTIPNEGVFVLGNSGVHSSVRSHTGFPGSLIIEKTLTSIIEHGDLSSVIDGTNISNWQAKSYNKSLLRTSPQDVPWVPSDYQQGLAIMMTAYLDRPIYISEIFINPSNDNPFYLLSVSWTPLGVKNFLDISTFTTATTGTTTFDSSKSTWTVAGGSGFATFTFDLSSHLSYSPSPGVVITPSATSLSGTRAQLNFSMQGVGNTTAGIRISWLDASGHVIDTQYLTDYINTLTQTYSLPDFIPSLSCSGKIDIGIFNSDDLTASVTFPRVEMLLGENIVTPAGGYRITKPTTITLPTTIHSNRISLVFAQTDPYRETSAISNGVTIPSMPLNRDLTNSLQKEINNQIDKLNFNGAQQNFFVYSIGLTELDFRYREFIPHGRLVSKPVNLSREVRNIWINADIDTYNGNNTSFYVYPYEDNEKFKYLLNPFLVQNSYSKQSSNQTGEILTILTSEEYNNGWGTDLSPTPMVLPEIPYTDTFNGTDQNGVVSLTYPASISRIKINKVQSWLDDNSIWPSYFDPNSTTIYSLNPIATGYPINTVPGTGLSIVQQLRKGTVPVIFEDLIINQDGYIPIKVTVRTSDWTAYPDTYGKPQQNIIKVALSEKLTLLSGGKTSTQTTSSNTTNPNNTPSVTTASVSSLTDLPALPSGWSWNKIGPQPNGKIKYTAVHNLLGYVPTTATNVQSGQTTKTTTNTTTTVYNGVFKTAFQNILTGKSGTFIDLWWQNPITGELVAISPANYDINTVDGTVSINSAPPPAFVADSLRISGDPTKVIVLANYKYISNQTNVTYYNDILDYITPSSSGLFGDVIRPFTTSYPVTRNMTDYISGTTPTLTPPNFDKLSNDYYPVIEYYVDSDNLLHFATSFWVEGDTPGEIEVDYFTLKLRPRVGVEVNRVNAPTSSNFIHAISLGVKEASIVPTQI